MIPFAIISFFRVSRLSVFFLTAVLSCTLVVTGCDSAGGLPLLEGRGLEVAWTYEFDGDAPTHSPVVVGDSLVLVSGDAYLTSLRLRDGSVKWRAPVDPEMPLLADRVLVDARHAYGTHYTHRRGETTIRAWRLDTGTEAWRRTYTGDRLALYEGMALSDTYIFLSSDVDGQPAFALNKRTGAFAFDHHRASAGAHLIGHDDGTLYARTTWVEESGPPQVQLNESRVVALRDDRPDSLWTFATAEGGLYLDPIIQEGVMYVGLSTSNSAPGLTYLAVDLETREVRWRTSDVGAAAHLVADGRIFVREGNARLVALDAASGHVLWRTEPASAHTSFSPHHLLDGSLYYPHYDGLRVIGVENGELLHVEPPRYGYLWEAAVGHGTVVAQYSGAVVAYRPYRGRR
jgi:outer membrane protein assembly factor BamB